MHTPNQDSEPDSEPDGEPEKPYRIKLTLTEAILCAAVSGLFFLGSFALLLMRLQKRGAHSGLDWIAALFLLFALLNAERTIKFIRLAVRFRRLANQDREMRERQKRAGWN